MELRDMLENYWGSYYSLTTRTPVERYKDFKSAFSTPAGQRVLDEIMSWGHITDPMLLSKKDNSIDKDRILVALGERNILLKLLGAIHIEPKVIVPPKINRTKPKKSKGVR